MSLKNASVALTYKIEGAMLQLGKYEYKERTTTGSIIEEYQRLFVVTKPVISDCYKKVTLGEIFVNYAISEASRPYKNADFKAFTFWNKMTEEERLNYHVARLVKDMKSTDYNYTILQ